MPITPLHVTYAWPLKLRFRSLSFSALTIGSMIPDVENVVMFFLGINPNRLVTHSLIGVVTVDIALTTIACYVLYKSRIERFGINGFNTFSVTRNFLGSAALGSLTHALIDYTHHEFNPLFWPFGPTYISGPLVDLLGVFGAHAVAQVATFLLLLYIIRRILHQNGNDLYALVSKPRTALEMITGSLSK